jgi:hypothetical protein
MRIPARNFEDREKGTLSIRASVHRDLVKGRICFVRPGEHIEHAAVAQAEPDALASSALAEMDGLDFAENSQSSKWHGAGGFSNRLRLRAALRQPPSRRPAFTDSRVQARLSDTNGLDEVLQIVQAEQNDKGLFEIRVTGRRMELYDHSGSVRFRLNSAEGFISIRAEQLALDGFSRRVVCDLQFANPRHGFPLNF